MRSLFLATALFAAVAIVAPALPTFAAISPTKGLEKDTKSAEDACKTGMVEVEGGVITGGGSNMSNYVVLTTTGNVQVGCRPVEPGERATIKYCAPKAPCVTVLKDSKEGTRLLRIFDSAYQNGVWNPKWREWEIDSRNLLEQLATPDQMQIVDTAIIGKLGPGSELQDYSHIIDALSWTSATEDRTGKGYNRASLESSLQDIIDNYAATSKPPTPRVEIEYKVGQPYRLDVLTPSESMLYYGSQYVPSFERAREFTQEDFVRLNMPSSAGENAKNLNSTFEFKNKIQPAGDISAKSGFEGFFLKIGTFLSRLWIR